MRFLASVFIALQVCLHHQVFIEASSYSARTPPEIVDLYKQTACSKWCPSGRECAIKDGKEVCVCLTKCPSRHKPVCGSDGQLYDNHCELHRKACVTQQKIKIDWGNRCQVNQESYEDSGKSGITERNRHGENDKKDVSVEKTEGVNVEVFTEKPNAPMPVDASGAQKSSEDAGKSTDTNRHTNLFFAFGNDGIYVIDPEKLSLIKHIKANDVISGSQSTTCTGTPPKSCTWGGAVNAGNKKIYAADSSGRRLIIFDVESLSAVEAIETDYHPYSPQYVEVLDEVWFTGLTSAVQVLTEEQGDNGTVNVVSKATKSAEGPHEVTKVDSKSHAIYGLHLTDTCHTRDEEMFGYVTHLDEPGFHEVGLKDKEFTRFFNLSSYGCHGTYGFALSVTTGHAIANCYTTQDGGQRGQFIVDLNTKEVVATTTVSIGTPHISPDGRFVVTLNEYTISAVYFSNDGTIEMGEPIKTNMLLSDVAFFPRDYGYDLYVTSKDSQSIVVVHADPSGMNTIDVLTDVGIPNKEKKMLHTKRNIVIGCEGHARFLATPATAENEVIIIDGQQLSVKGKIANIKGVTSLVWVGEDDI